MNACSSSTAVMVMVLFCHLLFSCAPPTDGVKNPDIAAPSGGFEVNAGLRIQAEACTDKYGVSFDTMVSGGTALAHVEAGEWLSFPLIVTRPGLYVISFRYASTSTGNMGVQLGNRTLSSGNVVLPATAGNAVCQTVSRTVDLGVGDYELGINAPEGDWYLDWVELSLQTAAATSLQDGAGYRIQSLFNGLALAAADASVAENAPLALVSVADMDWQYWTAHDLGSGAWRFTAAHSSRDLQRSTVSTLVSQGTWANSATQQWDVSFASTGASISAGGKALEAGLQVLGEGSNVLVDQQRSVSSQHWRFVQISAPGLPSKKHGKTLVWNDEFASPGSPDSTNWTYDLGAGGWGNNELQTYTNNPMNVSVANGLLSIVARKDGAGKWTSARLASRGKRDWIYGYFEIRAKLPPGKGTWPAIWMLPTDKAYGNWPKSGEIDIMEHVGYDPNEIHTTIHTETYNHTKGTQKVRHAQVPDVTTTFHSYGILWEPGSITWYIDDAWFYSVSKAPGDSSNEWPFDQAFHLLLNVAMGGNWGGAQGMDPSLTQACMEIDWVRVYQ